MSATKTITYSTYVHAKSCTRVYFEYSSLYSFECLASDQHTKLNRAMLFTPQIFVSKCDITSEWYRSCVAMYIRSYSTIQILYGRGHGPLVTACRVITIYSNRLLWSPYNFSSLYGITFDGGKTDKLAYMIKSFLLINTYPIILHMYKSICVAIDHL